MSHIRQLCVNIFSTPIAGVGPIVYNNVLICISDNFLANSCLVLTLWILLDVRVS